jgi:putative phage-type endonuclease
MGKHQCVFHAGEQGSPEWFLARLGKVTASRFGDVMSKGRGSAASKTSESYMMELLGERLTGEFKQIVNAAVSWGSENEDRARQLYQWRTENRVQEVGLATMDTNPMVGASTDGMVEDDGVLEIKCPYNSANHLQTIAERQVPKAYEWQVQGQMWVAEVIKSIESTKSPEDLVKCKRMIENMSSASTVPEDYIDAINQALYDKEQELK